MGDKNTQQEGQRQATTAKMGPTKVNILFLFIIYHHHRTITEKTNRSSSKIKKLVEKRLIIHYYTNQYRQGYLYLKFH